MLGQTILIQHIEHCELGYRIKTLEGRELFLEQDSGPYHEMRCFQHRPWHPIMRFTPRRVEQEEQRRSQASPSEWLRTLSISGASTAEIERPRPIAVVAPIPRVRRPTPRRFLSEHTRRYVETATRSDPVRFRELPRYLWVRDDEQNDTQRSVWQRRHNLVLMTGDEIQERRERNLAVVPPRPREHHERE